MSTSTVVLEALNQQINAELGASYEYLAMSAWCTSQNLLGTAKWLRLQSQEEYGHAMKLFDFVLDRGGEVSLKAMAAPVNASLHDVFERVSKQEQAVSGQIDSLYELAFREKRSPRRSSCSGSSLNKWKRSQRELPG
jgi:ferritin